MIRVIALGLLMAFLSVSAMAQSKAQLQSLYVDFLKKKGYEVKVDDDGDVAFSLKNRNYFIDIDETDPLFFRLVLPNIWPIESEEERQQVFQAVDYANNRVKMGKIFTVRDNVWVSVEVYQRTKKDFQAIFNNSLRAIDQCVDEFVGEMR